MIKATPRSKSKNNSKKTTQTIVTSPKAKKLGNDVASCLIESAIKMRTRKNEIAIESVSKFTGPKEKVFKLKCDRPLPIENEQSL